MRVDSMQIPSQGGLKVRTGAETVVSSLEEGDSIKAEALANYRGSVLMKTDDGQTFKARLDSDVSLSVGEAVLLEMTGKEAGVVTLSIRGEAALGEASERFMPASGFEDKTLSAYAEKLAELNMPVTEETASLMREIMSLNPGMTLDEAAFIASNGLTGDETLIGAALSILPDGEKLDAMIERLLALMTQPDAAEPLNAELDNKGYVGRDALIAPPGETGVLIVPPAVTQQTGVTEWITLIKDGMMDAAKASLLAEPKQEPIVQEIISQSESAMQSRNLENNEEMLKINISAEKAPLLASQETENMPATESASQPTSIPLWGGVARSDGVVPPDSETVGKAIAGLLSELPEFRGVPEQILERFSDMLLRIAGDSEAASGGDVGKLMNLLDKLFTRIGKNDSDAGARLKSAKEELFARLMFLEEAISRAEPSAKNQMLDQTRKLMDHIRLLNNIDQFVYMQLPVHLGEERKTAELYLFKKKNGKKLDPEDVNILLALDLENMGRWEGLLNIRKRDVSIRMEVAGPKEKEYFSENTVLLHELLAGAGFKLVNTDIAYTVVETTPLTALSALDRMTADRIGKIDFTV